MRKSGFTLIELVMVIVIIGILAAVAIPRFMDLQKEAKKARCQADVGAIRTGISGWYAKFFANTTGGGNNCPSTMYPSGVAGDCNANGFPIAAQLNTNTSQFAQFAFSNSVLPDPSHIVNNGTCATWGAAGCYDALNGTLNQTALCE